MAFLDDHPQLIAHRGYSECYPENTMVGLEAALRAGADCIEFDVQFSKDGIPVVIHDNLLGRTTGVGGKVSQATAVQLAKIFAGEIQRFGDQFMNEPIPTLSTVLNLLDRWPEAMAFVEIKTEAIESIGLEIVAQRLVSELEPYGDQCVLISSNTEVIELASRLGMKRTGWVIRKWDEHSKEQASVLKPDILFCNYKKIPDSDEVLWPGPWQWALYDIVDPQTALHWISRGVKFIESWDIGRLLRDKQLVSCLGKKN